MNRVYGVLLDVDGTLYHQNLLRFLIAFRFLICGIARPLRTFREFSIVTEYRNSQERLRNRLPLNAFSKDAQIDITAALTGASHEEISRCISKWMEKVPPIFFKFSSRKYLVSLIHRWHGLGVPLGVYSDYPCKNKLRALGLGSVISVVVSSGDPDVMALKPAKTGFEVGAGKLGLDPSQVVYIGDREDVDAVGARNAGMRSIVVRRSRRGHKTKQELAILDQELRQIFEIRDSPFRRRLNNAY